MIIAGDMPVMLSISCALHPASRSFSTLDARSPYVAFLPDPACRRAIHQPRPRSLEAVCVVCFALRRLHEGGAAPALQRTHQIVVKGHPQLLAGLLLHHVDPAVLNVAWGHTQHIRLSLAGVSSQQNSTAHILPRMLLNQAVGPHRPRSSTFL